MLARSTNRLAFSVLLLILLPLAPAWAGDVTVKLQGNYTVTTGTTRITIPTSWMQAGHAYTLTAAPVSGNTSAYGDPYLWSVVYVDGSTTRTVVYQSRHTPDIGERTYLQEDMWSSGQNKAEFWVRCEVASCYMKLTVYEREEGTFDRKTFYRDGVEYRVIDGQYSLYKDFYHSIEKNGDYGLQIDFDADRYLYLYRDDNFSTSGVNALSFWVRSSGSIDEDDLTVVLTTGDHYMLTPTWKPLSDYIEIEESHTWYRVVIPLSDLNPSGSSIRGLALMSDRSGLVYLDDVVLTTEDLSGGGQSFTLRLPVSGYTPYTVPISASMDNSLASQGGEEGVIESYDGDVATFGAGCLRYTTSGYFACSGSVLNYNPPSDVLGYRKQGGGAFLSDLNYTDRPGGDNTYLFYDEHTGYDFALPSGTTVYAAAGGTLRYEGGDYNTIVIDHGNGYETYYLHMLYTNLAPEGPVARGVPIGRIGGTGGVSPHLHFTVKRDGLRIDPYREDLWD